MCCMQWPEWHCQVGLQEWCIEGCAEKSNMAAWQGTWQHDRAERQARVLRLQACAFHTSCPRAHHKRRRLNVIAAASAQLAEL